MSLPTSPCESARTAPAQRSTARHGGALARRLRQMGHDSNRQQALFRGRNVSRAAVLEARGRQMRSALTPSEQLLWSRICARQLGVVFRRQVPLLGRFIADFYRLRCASWLKWMVPITPRASAAGARRDAVLVRVLSHLEVSGGVRALRARCRRGAHSLGAASERCHDRAREVPRSRICANMSAPI